MDKVSILVSPTKMSGEAAPIFKTPKRHIHCVVGSVGSKSFSEIRTNASKSCGELVFRFKSRKHASFDFEVFAKVKIKNR